MTRENIRVTMKDMEVVDGKVVISSEELAMAVQDYKLDPNADEEADAETIGFFCRVG